MIVKKVKQPVEKHKKNEARHTLACPEYLLVQGISTCQQTRLSRDMTIGFFLFLIKRVIRFENKEVFEHTEAVLEAIKINLKAASVIMGAVKSRSGLAEA